MNEAVDAHLFIEACADYCWCIRAGLLDSSSEDWREFMAGYFAMEEFYKSHDARLAVCRVA